MSVDSVVSDVLVAARDVNKHLGPSMRENAYHKAMIVALSEEGVALTTEATVSVMYRGKSVARMHPDMVVGDDVEVVLEFKSGGIDHAESQLQNYLDYGDFDAGLLIGFGEDLEYTRVDP